MWPGHIIKSPYFFDKVANLPRIVNLRNIKMTLKAGVRRMAAAI
jgi:Tfp pilus assembly protein PilO